MILLLLALHMTPPEKVWCANLRGSTLQECIHRQRRWICSPEDVGDEIETMPEYARTIREERRLVCHNRRR